MHIVSIGIDLGKTTFQPVALGERNLPDFVLLVETALSASTVLRSGVL